MLSLTKRIRRRHSSQRPAVGEEKGTNSNGPGFATMGTDDDMAPGDQAPAGTAGTGENLCPKCGGTGRKDNEPCKFCEGTGRIIEGVGGA